MALIARSVLVFRFANIICAATGTPDDTFVREGFRVGRWERRGVRHAAVSH